MTLGCCTCSHPSGTHVPRDTCTSTAAPVARTLNSCPFLPPCQMNGLRRSPFPKPWLKTYFHFKHTSRPPFTTVTPSPPLSQRKRQREGREPAASPSKGPPSAPEAGTVEDPRSEVGAVGLQEGLRETSRGISCGPRPHPRLLPGLEPRARTRGQR